MAKGKGAAGGGTSTVQAELRELRQVLTDLVAEFRAALEEVASL